MKTLRVLPVALIALAVAVVGSACVPPFLTLTTSNPQAYADFGQAVAVGDVNGDGKGDIVVGAPWEQVGANLLQGRVYVFSGADGSQLPWSPLTIAAGRANARFGSSVAVSDVGDGKINDGCPAVGPPETGVQCNNALDDDADGKINDGCPAVGPPETGAQCANALDDDIDGKADIVVGAPGDEEIGVAGQVYVFSGADGSPLAWSPLTDPGAQTNSGFGRSVAVGDVDSDGKADIAVGAPEEDVGGGGPGTPPPTYVDQGRAYVFSGAGGSLLRTLDMPLGYAQPDAYFGYSVAVGRVDEDRYADIAVGAPYANADQHTDQGQAYVFAGSDGSLLRTLDIPPDDRQVEAHFGRSVAVGDVSGDQHGDIAVGASEEDVGGNVDQGRAYVFSGLDWSLVYTLNGPVEASAYFGQSVAVGDVNGDGRGDIAVGAHGAAVSSNTRQGVANVFSGADGSGWVVMTTANPQTDAFFGTSVALGDVNGNGKAEIAVGAPGETAGGNTYQGRVYMYSAGYPRAATYHYTVQCAASGVSLITPPGTPEPKGPFAGTGTADVTCGSPYWQPDGHQCADCTIDSLDCEGVLQGVGLVISRLPQSTPVPEVTPVPSSRVKVCEQSSTSSGDMVVFIEAAEAAGGMEAAEATDDGGTTCCSCYDGLMWSSINCTSVTSGPGGNFTCSVDGNQYNMCQCGGSTPCADLQTPRGGAFVLVGGIAQWPGTTDGSDQSALQSSGSGSSHGALGAALAAMAVLIVVAAGAWLARRRWAR